MLYVDHRTYTFKPLKMGKWLALYEECALPVQLKYLGNLIGFFQTEIGTLNQVVHLWGFSISTTVPRAAPRWPRIRPGTISCARTRNSQHCCTRNPRSSFPSSSRRCNKAT